MSVLPIANIMVKVVKDCSKVSPQRMLPSECLVKTSSTHERDGDRLHEPFSRAFPISPGGPRF